MAANCTCRGVAMPSFASVNSATCFGPAASCNQIIDFLSYLALLTEPGKGVRLSSSTYTMCE